MSNCPYTAAFKTVKSLTLFSISEHNFKVVAVDAGGRSAQVGVTVHIDDVNDSPPRFKKRIYQGFMTPDLTR